MIKIVLFFIVLIAANLPWLSDNFLYFIPLKTKHKNLAWSAVELILFYFIALGITLYSEYASYGNLAPQSWEFYSVTFCLFLVFSFPGFIHKILWKK